jgi:hypothetical protein
LLLGEPVGAERIFFLGDDQVLVFPSLPSETSEQEIMAPCCRAKCMVGLAASSWPLVQSCCLQARRSPVGPDEPDRRIEPLDIVRRTADVGAVFRHLWGST